MYKMYKGYQYRQTPFGNFEIYHLDRFKQFDTLSGMKSFIKQYEAISAY